MLRSAIIPLLIVIAFSCEATACDCFGPLNFCETLHDHNPALVVLAVKKADQAHGMQVEILEILKGVESRQKVMVWGDNGLLCRHYATQWNVGDTVIFSLHRIVQSSALPQEDSTDYFISVCGTYFLNYAGGQVSGAINGVDTIMTYTAFKNSLPSCLTAVEAPNHPFSGVMVYPNPAHDMVEIALPSSFLNPAQIRLFSFSGRELPPGYMLISSEPGNVKLRTATLPQGSYILQITDGEHIISRKLIIL